MSITFLKKNNITIHYHQIFLILLKVLLLSIVITPLLVDSSVFFMFTSAKSLFVRGVLSLEGILFICLFVINTDFRDKILLKLNKYIRNPIFIAVFVLLISYIISTIFAVNTYIAFWGDLQRAEGLAGFLFYFTFFIFSLLIFEKKDWILFFKLSFVVGFMLVLKEFYQFFSGVVRPGSFVHNPAFLSGYLLFPIFSFFVIFNEIKLKLFKYFSIFILLALILGIFITETRGTILGLFLGVIFVLIYFLFDKKTKDILILKRLNLYKLSIIILLFIFSFFTIFAVTNKSEVWSRVPGFSRFASMSMEDSTMNTRLLTSKIGIESVNPKENGVKKLLIGWGPDNYYLAYGKYFDSKQFNYEDGWFDRAHDKFVDVLVMNGLLGFFVYIAIFILLFRFVFKSKLSSQFASYHNLSLLNIGLILFGVSYAVHTMFLFDQILTSLALFSVLSFIIFIDSETYLIKKEEIYYKLSKYMALGFVILIVFITFLFSRNDLVGYLQSRRYHNLLYSHTGTVTFTIDEINKIFYPMTVAQFNIRSDFVNFIEVNKVNNELSKIGYLMSDQYLDKDPLNVQLLATMADDYTNRGKEYSSIEYLNNGEIYYKRIINFSENRIDFLYKLAVNLYIQKKYDESYYYFNKSYNNNPKIFMEYSEKNNNIYLDFYKSHKHI